MAVPEVRVSTHISAADTFWWVIDEPANPMVINVVTETDGVWTPKSVRAVLEPAVLDNVRLHSVPAHRCGAAGGPLALLMGCLAAVVNGGFWYWAPVEGFAIEDYIKLKVLESPNDECLHRFVDEEISHPLPKDLAQWRAVVIHNVPGGGSRLLFRFHHVIADGAGLGQWFHGLCETKDAGPSLLPHQTPKSSELRGERQMTWAAPPPGAMHAPAPAKHRGMVGLLLRLRDIIDFFLVEVLLAVYSALKMLFLVRDSNSPLKGPKMGRKKTATTLRRLPLPVEEVKALGKGYDSSITVNDTLCTLLAGAFRRMFRRHSLHPEQMTMRAAVPMNMRTSNRPPIDMDNRFSLVFKSLPIHLPTVEERLATFHVRMGLVKLGIEPRLGMILMCGLAWMPAGVVARVMDHFTVCGSVVLTNVLSSRTPLHFAGQRVDNVAFWVPTSGDLGVGISICTYCDDINIGLMADENLLSDLDPLLEDIKAEWAEMKQRLGTPDASHPSADIPLHPQDILTARKVHGSVGCSR